MTTNQPIISFPGDVPLFVPRLIGEQYVYPFKQYGSKGYDGTDEGSFFWYVQTFTQATASFRPSKRGAETKMEVKHPKRRGEMVEVYLIDETEPPEGADTMTTFKRIWSPDVADIDTWDLRSFTRLSLDGLKSKVGGFYGVSYDNGVTNHVYSARKEVQEIGSLDELVIREGVEELLEPSGTLYFYFTDNTLDFSVDCSLSGDLIQDAIELAVGEPVYVAKNSNQLKLTSALFADYHSFEVRDVDDAVGYDYAFAGDVFTLTFVASSTAPTGLLSFRNGVTQTVFEGVDPSTITPKGSLSVTWDHGASMSISDMSASCETIYNETVSAGIPPAVTQVWKLYNADYGEVYLLFNGPSQHTYPLQSDRVSESVTGADYPDVIVYQGCSDFHFIGAKVLDFYDPLNSTSVLPGGGDGLYFVRWSIDEQAQGTVNLDRPEFVLDVSRSVAALSAQLEGMGATEIAIQKDTDSVSIAWTGADLPAWAVGEPAPTELDVGRPDQYKAVEIAGVGRKKVDMTITDASVNLSFTEVSNGSVSQYDNPSTLRRIRVDGHGRVEGQRLPLWLEDELVAKTTVIEVESEDSILVPVEDVQGSDFKATHTGNLHYLTELQGGDGRFDALITAEFFIEGLNGIASGDDVPDIEEESSAQKQIDVIALGNEYFTSEILEKGRVRDTVQWMQRYVRMKTLEVFGAYAVPEPIDPNEPTYDYTPPLDGYDNGLMAGYALFRLTSTYDGSCLYLKKTDGQIVEIGFADNGWIDLDAILIHLGSNGVGEIVQWNDQSGNNNNATQSQTGRYPIIRTETDFIYSNGKPSISFLGGASFFNFSEISNIRSVLWLLDSDDDTTYNSIMGHDSSYDFHCGKDGEWFHTSYSSSHIRSGELYFNNSSVSPTAKRSLNWGVLQLDTTGNVSANQLTEDRNLVRSLTGTMQAVCLFSEVKTSNRAVIHDRFVNVMTDKLN